MNKNTKTLKKPYKPTKTPKKSSKKLHNYIISERYKKLIFALSIILLLTILFIYLLFLIFQKPKSTTIDSPPYLPEENASTTFSEVLHLKTLDSLQSLYLETFPIMGPEYFLGWIEIGKPQSTIFQTFEDCYNYFDMGLNQPFYLKETYTEKQVLILVLSQYATIESSFISLTKGILASLNLSEDKIKDIDNLLQILYGSDFILKAYFMFKKKFGDDRSDLLNPFLNKIPEFRNKKSTFYRFKEKLDIWEHEVFELIDRKIPFEREQKIRDIKIIKVANIKKFVSVILFYNLWPCYILFENFGRIKRNEDLYINKDFFKEDKVNKGVFPATEFLDEEKITTLIQFIALTDYILNDFQDIGDEKVSEMFCETIIEANEIVILLINNIRDEIFN